MVCVVAISIAGISKRLKPQLQKQNPPMRVEDLDAVDIVCVAAISIAGISQVFNYPAVETAATETKPADAG